MHFFYMVLSAVALLGLLDLVRELKKLNDSVQRLVWKREEANKLIGELRINTKVVSPPPPPPQPRNKPAGVLIKEQQLSDFTKNHESRMRRRTEEGKW